MIFLPVAERELRIACRRRETYWMRSVLALAVSVIWLCLLAAGRNGVPPGEMGKVLFAAIGILALLFTLFSGVFLTADCLSQERREGTLGLLFLTDLRGYDVVSGKLVATSLPAFYGLLTILPLLALPLLMGGVSVGEFWRVALVLVVTLLFSLSVGLVVSAFSRETRAAMSAALLILIVATGVLPLLEWAVEWLFRTFRWREMLWPSPAFLYSRAFDGYFQWRTGGREFWASLLTIAGLAVGGLLFASVYLQRAWREGGEGAAMRESDGWRRRLRFGGQAFRASRRLLLSEDPIFWLASRDRMPHWLACGTVGGLLAIWFCFLTGCFFQKMPTAAGFCFPISLLMAVGLHLVLKWQVAVESCRRFSDDRHSGALELLLVTPLSVEDLLNGQRRALLEIFWAPLLLVLVTNAGLFGLLVFPNSLHINGDGAAIFGEVVLLGAFVLLTDYYALTWVGMCMALRAKRHQRAVAATLARVLVGPWLAILMIYFFGVTGVFGGSGTALMVMLLWHGIGFIIDLTSAAWARSELLWGLREVHAGVDLVNLKRAAATLPAPVLIRDS